MQDDFEPVAMLRDYGVEGALLPDVADYGDGEAVFVCWVRGEDGVGFGLAADCGDDGVILCEELLEDVCWE